MSKKQESKKIAIRCEGSGLADVTELTPFQGNLKTLTKAKFEKLRGLILSQGFSFTPFVWKDPQTGTLYLLDGHQRRATLLKLRDAGYEIPKIPFAEVHASTFKEAKEKLLSAVAQFGEIDKQGLYEFLAEADIDFSFLESNFAHPEVDLDAFKAEFYADPEGEAQPEVEGDIQWAQELKPQDNYVIMIFKDREEFEAYAERFGVERAKMNVSRNQTNENFDSFGKGRVVSFDKIKDQLK